MAMSHAGAFNTGPRKYGGEMEEEVEKPEEEAVDTPPAEGDAPPAEGDVVEQQDEAPPGHDEWIQNFAYAAKTNPFLYGMCQKYAEDMAKESAASEGEQAAAPPPEEGAEAAPPSEEDAALQQTLASGATSMPKPTDQGVAAMQDSNAPVTYAALREIAGAIGALRNELVSVKKQSVSDKQQLAKLSQANAEKETDLIMYEFGQAGVKAMADDKKKEQIRNHLISLSEQDRNQKALEIMTYWDKDENVQYEHKGAPVGDWLHVDERQVEGGAKEKFGDAELAKALTYMKSDPPELRGLGYEEKWAKCQQYAMNGTLVHG